ncbi:MAG: TonB-dependent receptor [Alteromonadaceae bacterium]|nr:TonB-dependent receptor [Alteromonadaceae bacterium]
MHVKKLTCFKRVALASAIISALGINAHAQEANDDTTDTENAKVEKIAVVGSKIANMRTEAALPVAVIGQDTMDALGTVDGNELIRSMPQMGDITWNESWIPGSSNAARGDMGSMNLKNMGASNTLLLINGRRSVIHPTTSTVDDGVSTTTFNSNAIPMYGLDRIEVLLDGAAAIYGSDAIAGVVNVVTQGNLSGAGVKLKYGKAMGTERADTDLTGYYGTDFDSGKGNFSLMYNVFYRTAQRTGDKWYTATSDRRDFLPGTDLAGTAALDGRSSYSPWGVFNAPYQIFQNGVALTNASGHFHAELADSADCVDSSYADTCFAVGSTPREYRYDGSKDSVYQTPQVMRTNLFSTFTYFIQPDLEFFGEAGIYYADTKYLTGPGGFSSSQEIIIPANAYYNPLGAMTLADGSLNPYRLPGLDNVPAEGAVLEVQSHRLAELGTMNVDVENSQFRLLTGLRGWTANDFEWESAILVSQAKSIDVSEVINVQQLAASMSGTTADAFNPFVGGNTQHINYGGSGFNSAETLSSFLDSSTRESTSQLASWDFKINKSDMLVLPAGDLGFAAGIEVRYESLKDDRDPLVDGSAPYINEYDGSEFDSNLGGSSPTPDSYGSRNVKTAYMEFAVPLVSPDFNIPLVQSVDMQLAGRYESYSDVGDISTPKVALAWAVDDNLVIRGSWSEGFKAPNLEVLNASEMVRYLNFTDFIYCEAALRTGEIANYSQCSDRYPITWHMAGNKDLKPETSTNQSVGVLFTPQFLPKSWGNVKMTLDFWQIQLDDQIGVAGAEEVLISDLFLRTVEGTVDPRIVRFDPTPNEIARFAGTGLDPVGQVQYMQTNYANRNSLEAKGMDFTFDWRSVPTDYGQFSFNFTASQLRSYQQALSAEMQIASDAQQAGLLDPFISIVSADEVGQNGRKPEWKLMSFTTWSYENFVYRLSAQYTDSVISGRYANGDDFVVPSTTIWNTSAQYEFDENTLGGLIAEVGVRNLFDKTPPLSSNGTYLANMYLPYTRYIYASIEKRF